MRLLPVRIAFFLTVFALFNPSLLTAAENRTALIIGNSTYSSGPLKNPVNDAADMAAVLQQLGFKVILKKNANLEIMENAVEDFGNQLKRGGVGLFYYAGHAVQVNGVNYLIPVGAKINKESDVRFKAFDAGRILAEMENAGNGLNIVLLDACRDNPFGKSFRSSSRGLAIVSSSPSGTFISYSTSPGQVARDGEGRNSPYTKAVLENITQPGLAISDMFIRVRSKVKKETGQVPWELSSLEGQFYFNKKDGEALTPPSAVEQKIVASILPMKVGPGAEGQQDNYFSLLARDGWNEAMMYFQTTITLSPDDTDVRAGLAVAEIFKGDEGSAKYNVRRIKESKVESRWTRVAAGLVEGVGENYEEGLYQLNRALNEGADRALVNLCIGIIAERKGKWDVAEKAADSYRIIVPENMRGQPFQSLAKRINIRERIAGSYYYTGPEGTYDASIAYHIMTIGTAGNEITAKITAPADIVKYTLSDIRVEGRKLIFKNRTDAWGGGKHFWSVGECVADLSGDMKKIPWTAKQIDGNCGQIGSYYKGFLIRKSPN